MIENNSHSIAKIEPESETSREINRDENYEDKIEGENFCPHCRIMMIRLGLCFSCPRCGYGGCG